MSDPLLQASRLSFVTGGRTLIGDVSLTLLPGEVHAVIGCNGAGKSTLLKLLTGDLRPTSGSVLLEGRPLETWSPGDLARRRAVLAQHTHLTFDYRVLEVVLLGRLPHLGHRRETAADEQIAANFLEAVGLGGWGGRRYLPLSGGERQRVHLARVLAQLEGTPSGQPLLFLDEPTSSLDLHHQHRALALTCQMAARGAGVLVILHDLNLAARYADRLTLLKEGRLVATGLPAEILTEPLLSGAFNHPILVQPHPLHPCPLIIPA